jgi:hypothetical protein
VSCDECSLPYSLCQCAADAERERLAREDRAALDREIEDMFERDQELFDDEPACPAATHGPRNSTCTCEDSRDE